MAESSVPSRTCVGCRQRAPVTDLLRVVARAGSLIPDPRRRLPGRGASVHARPECLHAAERRRAFARALRSSTPLEAGPLRAHVLDAFTDAAQAGPRAGETEARTDRSPTVGPAPGRSARREQDVVE